MNFKLKDPSSRTYVALRSQTDGRVFARPLILQTVTLLGIEGFALHHILDGFGVTHLATGSLLAEGETIEQTIDRAIFKASTPENLTKAIARMSERLKALKASRKASRTV